MKVKFALVEYSVGGEVESAGVSPFSLSVEREISGVAAQFGVGTSLADCSGEWPE